MTVAEGERGGCINESTRRAPDGEVKLKLVQCNGVNLLDKQNKPSE